MKAVIGVLVLLVVIIAGVFNGVVNGQPCTPGNDDFFIYNPNGVALRINATDDHVHVCNDTDLCNFIFAQPVFTEVAASAYKTVPGSLYVAGGNTSGTLNYDGLTITAPQSFLWYGSKAAFRAVDAPLTGNRSALGASNIGVQSAAFGFNPVASGQASFAAGYEATATAEASVALGRLSFAEGASSLAAGVDVQSAQANNDTRNQVKGDFTPNHPSGNPDNTVNSLQGPFANGIGSRAFGLSTRASSTATTAFGYGSVASGPAATAWGVQSEAAGEGSTAFGIRTFATNYFTTSWGVQTEASGKRSTAFGWESVAAWPDSISAGFATSARAGNSFVTGIGNQASTHAATVVGSCNSDRTDGVATQRTFTNKINNNMDFPANGAYPGRQFQSTDYIFQVGNGASALEDTATTCYSLGSALTVLKNGDLIVAGNIYYGVGPDPYLSPDTPTSATQVCRCLSADGSCAVNSATRDQCTPDNGPQPAGSSFTSPNRRDDTITQMQLELIELKAQIAELTKMIKA